MRPCLKSMGCPLASGNRRSAKRSTVIHNSCGPWPPPGRTRSIVPMTVMALVLACSLTLLSPASSGSWQWPLRPVPTVLRGFSPPAVPWGPGHRGVDLLARPGQPVHAAGAGRVSFAGRIAGYGVVAITHGHLRTTYLPVVPSVRAGRQVPAGAVLGVLQDLPGHCGLRHCLHWGLRHGSQYLDPLSLLHRGVRLLPYWSPAPAPGSPQTRVLFSSTPFLSRPTNSPDAP